MDLLLKGGTVVTATESYEADVAVKDGKIAAVGRNLEMSAKQVVDVSIWRCLIGERLLRTAICRAAVRQSVAV